jgi:menaquinol-cytochrome c reductase iron-sulfur subunit
MPDVNDRGNSRRRFLKVATSAIGGAIGAVMAVPLVRYFLYPAGRKVVQSASEPVDVLPVSALKPGAPPQRVAISAASVRDAWTVSRNVPLGSAWVRRTAAGKVEAFSAVCPHLGCSVGWDQGSGTFRCPCHKSAFSADGTRIEGPAKRGLDPLPVKEEEGRVKITFLRFRGDSPDREPA